MKRAVIWLWLLCPWLAWARLEVAPESEPQLVFAAQAQDIAVVFHNPLEVTVREEIFRRYVQAGASVAVPLAPPERLKTLEVLPRQTIRETVSVTLPGVRARTRFQVQWLDAAGKILGRTELLAYPADTAEQVKALAGAQGPGIFDPENKLLPHWKSLRLPQVALTDVAQAAVFDGPLLIVAPFTDAGTMKEEMVTNVLARARAGRATLWLVAAPADPPTLAGVATLTRVREGTVVVAEDTVLAGLSTSLRSQLNLVRLAEMAVKPESAGPTTLLAGRLAGEMPTRTVYEP